METGNTFDEIYAERVRIKKLEEEADKIIEKAKRRELPVPDVEKYEIFRLVVASVNQKKSNIKKDVIEAFRKKKSSVDVFIGFSGVDDFCLKLLNFDQFGKNNEHFNWLRNDPTLNQNPQYFTILQKADMLNDYYREQFAHSIEYIGGFVLKLILENENAYKYINSCSIVHFGVCIYAKITFDEKYL